MKLPYEAIDKLQEALQLVESATAGFTGLGASLDTLDRELKLARNPSLSMVRYVAEQQIVNRDCLSAMTALGDSIRPTLAMLVEAQ